MKEKLFYQCNDCNGTLLEMSGTLFQYCHHNLGLLNSNNMEASKEKHIPVLEYKGIHLKVKVGSRLHPMTLDHSILWIFVKTRNGGLYVQLTPEDLPEADFLVEKIDVLGVYAYCDNHGLWMVDCEKLDYEELVCSAEFPQGCVE